MVISRKLSTECADLHDFRHPAAIPNREPHEGRGQLRCRCRSGDRKGGDSQTLKSLDRILRGMSHPEKGEWTYFTFKKLGVKFFIKPEWRDRATNTVLFPYRVDVLLSGLNPNECNWNTLIWHTDK